MKSDLKEGSQLVQFKNIRAPGYPGETALRCRGLEGGLPGNGLRGAHVLLESVKHRLVAQPGLLLTECGKIKEVSQ